MDLKLRKRSWLAVHTQVGLCVWTSRLISNSRKQVLRVFVCYLLDLAKKNKVDIISLGTNEETKVQRGSIIYSRRSS